MTVEIRILQKNDDRQLFHSTDEAINLYFHRYAGQNQFRHHIGATYVAVEHGRILGFVTVSPGSGSAEDLPNARKMPPYPIPILRIARLAVDESAQSHGIGRQLLRFSIEMAEQMMVDLGCVGILVDAKTEAIAFYERYGFVRVGLLKGNTRQVPRPTPMFLPLAAVPAPKESG